MNRVTLKVVFLFLALAISSRAQDGEHRFPALERLVPRELSDKKIPGAAIAVVSGGSVVYSNGFGVCDVETKRPVQVSTVFRLGSTTKMFTATAALLLAEQGKLDLSKPIGSYVRGLPPRLAGLTMEQILTHTAGLYDDAPMFGPDDEASLEREIRSWSDEKIFLEPGRFFSYSNPGYWLAGFILEQVTQKRFADIVADLVLKPMGMKNSSFRPSEVQGFDVSSGHDNAPSVIRPAANNASTWPAGSLFSTVQDISRFLTALLNEGKLEGKQVLPKSVVKNLFSPRVNVLDERGTRYGFGLACKPYHSYSMYFHAGARSGYGSIIRLVPEKGFAFVALANRTSALLMRSGDSAMAALMPFPGESAAEEAGPAVMEDKETDKLIGKYFTPPKTEIELTYTGKLLSLGRGLLNLKRGRELIPVRRIGKDRFTNGVFEFVLSKDSSGIVRYMHIQMHTLKRID